MILRNEEERHGEGKAQRYKRGQARDRQHEPSAEVKGAPHARQLETLREDLVKDFGKVLRLDIATVSHDVGIAVGKDNNVPGRERKSLPVLDIRISPSMRE